MVRRGGHVRSCLPGSEVGMHSLVLTSGQVSKTTAQCPPTCEMLEGHFVRCRDVAGAFLLLHKFQRTSSGQAAPNHAHAPGFQASSELPEYSNKVIHSRSAKSLCRYYDLNESNLPPRNRVRCLRTATAFLCSSLFWSRALFLAQANTKLLSYKDSIYYLEDIRFTVPVITISLNN